MAAMTTSNQTAAMDTKPKTVRVLMFDVSLPWAEFWYDAFNVLLFLGAFAVAVGTYGSIRMGYVKERFSDERMSANEKETKRAVAESDKANATLGLAQADIVKANAEIAIAHATAKALEKEVEQARAEQERLKAIAAWRRITRQQYDTLLANLKGHSISLFMVSTVTSDPEAIQYFDDIVNTLTDAKVELKIKATNMTRAAGLGVSDDDFPGKDILKRAFEAAGLPLTDVPNVPWKATLIVGSKPQPF
jgi:hypothetical protein